MSLIGISRSAESSRVSVALDAELNNASSPLPSRRFDFSAIFPFRCSSYQLARYAHISFSADRCDIVQHDWLTKTWRFSQPDITWDYGLEYRLAEIFPGICSNLT